MNFISPEQLAKDLVNVQPMPNDIMKQLSEYGMSRDKLISEGYKPVSSFGLLWIKDVSSKETV